MAHSEEPVTDKFADVDKLNNGKQHDQPGSAEATFSTQQPPSSDDHPETEPEKVLGVGTVLPRPLAVPEPIFPLPPIDQPRVGGSVRLVRGFAWTLMVLFGLSLGWFFFVPPAPPQGVDPPDANTTAAEGAVLMPATHTASPPTVALAPTIALTPTVALAPTVESTPTLESPPIPQPTATPVWTPTQTPSPILTPTPTLIASSTQSLTQAEPTLARSEVTIPDFLVGKILFLSNRDQVATSAPSETGAAESGRIFFYDPESGQSGRLAESWPYEVAATREVWSVDKQYEVYSKSLSQGGETSLALYAFDHGRQVEQLVIKMNAGFAGEAVWSPVGDAIVFVAAESGHEEIWVTQRNGTGLQQLAQSEQTWNKHPSLSPDGQKVVFFSNRTGNNQLWIMNRDGSEQRLLMAETPYQDWNPIWIKYPDAGQVSVNANEGFAGNFGQFERKAK